MMKKHLCQENLRTCSLMITQTKLAIVTKCLFGPKAAPAAPNGLKKAENGLNMTGYIQCGLLGPLSPPKVSREATEVAKD